MGVALGRGGGGRCLFWLGVAGRQAEDVCLDEFDGLLDVREAGDPETVVGVGDEVLDLTLVLAEEGVDVGFVDEARALGLREDEVEEEEEADVRVERDPVGVDVSEGERSAGGGADEHEEEPPDPGLNQESAAEDDPVHEPWCQLSGV